MPFLTVFTPAYNRAHTIERTYHSLIKQNNKDFIWLIVDDGSTDNTKDLVEKWIQNDNGFEIKYIYKTNGGMHTAHNVAYENISTPLNVCIDSDDCLANNAVQLIYDKWMQIKNFPYAGIIGLDADLNTGEIIGKDFPSELKETTLMEYYANGGAGDKKLVYYTDIIKRYPPYPIFEGERYVALGYKYRLIDQDYKLAVLNEVLCDVEYQTNGSSNSMLNQYIKNPKGFAFWRKICMTYPSSSKRCFVDCVHYVSSSILSRNWRFVKESPRKVETILAIIPGVALTMYIKYRTKTR